MSEIANSNIKGFLKVYDPNTEEVFFEGSNAIHFENISEALAQSMSNKNLGYIYQMSFGNGGTLLESSHIYQQIQRVRMQTCIMKNSLR